jgi:O-antigen/teichoic acid export membrane protein
MTEVELSKKVKHGIKWQFIANMVGQVIYLVNGVVLARILEPRDFGIYGMSLVLSNFVFMFWNLGLNAAIIQKKEIVTENLNTAFTLSLIMGISCFFIVWLSAPLLALFFKEPIIIPMARIIGATFIIYALDRVPTALLTKNMYFKQISLLGLANPAIYGVIAVSMALSGFGPLSFVWGVVAGALGVMAGKLIYGLKIFTWRPKFYIDKQSAKILLSFGVFIIISDILHYLYVELQRIVIGKYFGAVDLGYFNRASHLSFLPLQKVKTNVGNVLLPAFSKIQDNVQKIRNWFIKFSFFTYAFIVPPLMFFIFFPEDLISGVFGDKWMPAAPLLPIFSVTVIIGAMSIYSSNIFKAIGKPQLHFYIMFTTFIPFALLVFYSIRWGIKGIAFAVLIATTISFVLNAIILIRKQILYASDFIKPLSEVLFVSLVTGFIVYFFYHIRIRHIDKDEIRIITLGLCYFPTICCYYIYRIVRKSYISYLGFDIKKVVKI